MSKRNSWTGNLEVELTQREVIGKAAFVSWAFALLLCWSFVDAGTACTDRPTLQLYAGYSSHGLASLQGYVKELQAMLNQKGSYGLTVDGYFGSATQSAVRSYQSSHGLTVDGIVGAQTWNSLCGGSSTSCSGLSNPYPLASRGTSARWNPIAQFVVSKLGTCFPGKLSCSTYVSSRTTSDHPGNAADCFPGPGGVQASGQDLIDGNQIAAWLIANAATLKVRYVIWQNQIWNIRRASEGWRYQGKVGITDGHYDHIHISVYSSIN
uniref:Peptidoglycan binding-like domain-containing protein n=1 Tax=Compsopogon caeruleus TaxID=31354 RepID=A0A7S1TB59_9RHOD|mmetsp:Transcript_14516/g.29665  ORF Transcript_14516/g.29665 Transcript_14516/m.29665 type:complete len:266 (+) Transcript_14516:161-958(+)|eukprot:CAMPEP_0184677516 /NCGR_PEP_ID=MMETSP0312-20130426/98_1 /TAXON_ID=31354 /ORGANISM="Compsopogon coeruleus, Strain SAG 36.94" /LENGTH=265 /DNA_ID=CAMNT_0027125427 /DNA_START=161 /DNA_END=958 /DNA_ORIENTATION=+